MGKSKEFPQYNWVEPNSWTAGRKAGQPSVIFIHTTEGSEGTQSAEDGAAYDARRTDGTSTHFFVDQNSTVQCVETTDEAHAARAHGNDVGIQIEVCGRAGQSVAQWADAASAGAIDQAAQVCVAIRKKYGKSRFPLVNLTPAQLRAGQHGFAEHKDATLAWPEDGGSHTDPGPNFPWAKLFARINELEKEALVGTQFSGSTAGSDVEQLDKSAASITVLTPWETGGGNRSKVGDGVLNAGVPKGPGAATATNPRVPFWSVIRDMYVDVQELQATVGELKTALATLQADNRLLKQEVDKLTADPASGENAIVDALRYWSANP